MALVFVNMQGNYKISGQKSNRHKIIYLRDNKRKELYSEE